MPTPILIGVASLTPRSLSPADAVEPLTLFSSAISAALQDTSAPSKLQSSIDSISIIRTWSWPYDESRIVGQLASKLNLNPGYAKGIYTGQGGHQPVKLLDETARAIGKGEVKVGVVVGGEVLASVAALASQGRWPPRHWTEPASDPSEAFALDLSKFPSNTATKHGLGLPIHIYPLYENAYRAAKAQSIRDNHAESAELYAEFAGVAAKNESAWTFGQKPKTKDEIAWVGGKNRMICFPYPLLMNAFPNVNMASAAILTSAEYARELGIPEEKWIYPLAGAGTQDDENFLNRPSLSSSPALSQSLSTALSLAGVTEKELDLTDIYSCFPIVPKLAAQHLDLPLDKSLTLLGGLTSFGGAGNAYSLFAVGEAVRQLRAKRAAKPSRDESRGKRKGRNALILANGGVLTYQHAIVLSTKPRRDGKDYPEKNPLPEVLIYEDEMEVVEEIRDRQQCVVESYTVGYKRNGEPETGFVIGRLVGGKEERFMANTADESTLRALGSWEIEPIGRKGVVWFDEEDGRNVFAFEDKGKL